MFIPQIHHDRECEHAQWKKSPYFGPRWHWACSKSNFTRSHISSDRVRSAYEITTWNDLFCSCVDDVSIWWQMFNFVFLCPKRWFQFNSRIVRTHFSNIMTLNNWKMIAKTRSDIFRWRSRFRRRRVCLSSLITTERELSACVVINFCLPVFSISRQWSPGFIFVDPLPLDMISTHSLPLQNSKERWGELYRRDPTLDTVQFSVVNPTWITPEDEFPGAPASPFSPYENEDAHSKRQLWNICTIELFTTTSLFFSYAFSNPLRLQKC